MGTYLCHTEPDLYQHDAAVIDAAPGRVALSRSAFHPGGGGQVGDVGRVESSAGVTDVTHVEVVDGVWWHVLAEPTTELDGTVMVAIDADHRARVAALHTLSHVLNAFVFDEFEGSLVTGAQINGDGTGRMDFDLTAIDNDRLRALETPVNDVVGRGLEVRADHVDEGEAHVTPGLIRSLSVAPPPTPDGRLRVIDIAGLDRQACGGTHLSNTAQASGFRIGKIENKGKRNR
ncbi:MAG: alanyl-tRNA editing protein, partial [Actinomycetota bacterium]